MTRTIVLDSTCLIALERIGRLDLLPSLFDSLFAPPAVVHEFGTRPEWLQEQAPTNKAFESFARRESSLRIPMTRTVTYNIKT